MTKRAIAFVYKRKLSETDENYTSYGFSPVKVVKGIEIGKGDNKKFITDDDRTLYYIEDVANVNEEYVYAFPCYTDNVSLNRHDELYEELNDDFKWHGDKYHLYHIYENGEEYLQTFASCTISDEYFNCISVDPSTYEGFKNLKHADLVALREERESTLEKRNAIKKEETSLVVKQSDTEIPDVQIIIPSTKVIYTDDIFDYVTRKVICQDEPIKKMATAVAKNQRITNRKLKQNMLVCGPTGVGKTESFQCIADYINVPIAFEDATKYTVEGFKGDDVDQMLLHLYLNANRDEKAAGRGILVIDEMDKKAGTIGDHKSSTAAVQESLLKMMEGHTYCLDVPSSTGSKKVYLDTSFITFAFLGAYAGIEQYVKKTGSCIGFGNDIKKEEKHSNEEIYTNDSLIKYGLIPQFIGRNDRVIVMNSLGIPEFVRIINESEDNLLKLNEDFYYCEGIRLIFDDDAKEAIAKKALEFNTGARAIKRVINELLEQYEFEALSRNPKKEIIIKPEDIDRISPPVLKK